MNSLAKSYVRYYWLRLCLLTALLGSPGQAFAESDGGGGLVGNGGNTVFCTDRSGAKFSGLYTLDFLLDYRTSGPLAKLAEVPTWESSQQRILKNLLRFSPVLATSFSEFTSQVMNPQSRAGRKWTSFDLKGTLINDQEISKRLPENCYKTVDGKELPDLRQTVVRRYLAHEIEYLYDREILSHLASDRPLQFSFFIVHEWLWDFTQDVRELRRLNWILHSELSNTLSPEELSAFFLRSGFFNRYLPVCHRSQALRSAIEARLQKPCDKIAQDELTHIKTLDLTATPPQEVFRSGDFSGLYGLEQLLLGSNPGLLNRMPPYPFVDLLNLNLLDLRGSVLGEVPSHWLEGPRAAKILQ